LLPPDRSVIEAAARSVHFADPARHASQRMRCQGDIRFAERDATENGDV